MIELLPAEINNIESAGLTVPTHTKDLTCTALFFTGLCTIYEHRPLICRTWGLVKKMACPFGCIPDRWMTDREFDALMREIHELKKVPHK